MKKQNGITLVALVITIIVLLILAGVSVSMITGYDSIPDNAKVAVDTSRQDTTVEQNMVNKINNLFEKYLPATPPVTPPATPPAGEEIPLITTASGIHNDTTEYQDVKGNKIVVPGGFEVRTDLATTVDKGIVIQDSVGNQFVWIPVGEVIIEGKEPVEIELGRYTFSSENGSPIIEQSAENFEDVITIGNSQELTTFREAGIITVDGEEKDVNATAYNLEEFLTNAEANKGYYIARYEASYGSGNSEEDYIPLFQPSTAYPDSYHDDMTYTRGALWIKEMQGTASKICRNLYAGNEFVASDLVNSYAYDTAIVFIQKCSNSTNYSQLSFNGWNNTGTGTDLICNIHDLAGNLGEVTTEYSTYIQEGVWFDSWFYPVTSRGCSYGSAEPGVRIDGPLDKWWPSSAGYFTGFRAVLYVK